MVTWRPAERFTEGKLLASPPPRRSPLKGLLVEEEAGIGGFPSSSFGCGWVVEEAVPTVLFSALG